MNYLITSFERNSRVRYIESGVVVTSLNTICFRAFATGYSILLLFCFMLGSLKLWTVASLLNRNLKKAFDFSPTHLACKFWLRANK
jgi:hypothetical protein